MSIEEKLNELGITLPEVAKPVASYIPALVTGEYVYTSGQLPMVDGQLKYTGKLGRDLTVEQGADAARICTLNALAAIKSVIGSLDKVGRVVKVSGFVACTEDFFDQPKVINGASNLLAEIFGEKGKHTRSALGTNVLPLNSPVELEIIIKLIS